MRTERFPHCLRVAALLLIAVAAPVRAQAQPGQVIRIVVPSAAGGSSDVVARALAERLSQRLARPMIVENRTGASGQVGIQSVVRAKNDGTTLLVSPSGPMSINPHLQKLPYEPANDLTPVAMLARVPAGLAVQASSPYRTLGDLVAAGKASKNGLTYAIGVAGGHMHMVGQLLAGSTGMQLNPIPYRGNSQSVTAVVSGDVDCVISDMTTLLPLAKAGRLRIIAVTDSERTSMAPDVPTIGELGFPNSSADAWIGLFGPAGLAPEFVEQVNAEVARALRTPEMRSILAATGLYPLEKTPSALRDFLADDSAKWSRIVRERNIKIE